MLVQAGVLSPSVSAGYPPAHILPWLLLVYHIDTTDEDEEDRNTEPDNDGDDHLEGKGVLRHPPIAQHCSPGEGRALNKSMYHSEICCYGNGNSWYPMQLLPRALHLPS